jgi:hypothetical protein
MDCLEELKRYALEHDLFVKELNSRFVVWHPDIPLSAHVTLPEALTDKWISLLLQRCVMRAVHELREYRAGRGPVNAEATMRKRKKE